MLGHFDAFFLTACLDNILSRTPKMDEAVINELLKRMQAKGFDITKLEKNPQKPLPEKEEVLR